MPTTRLAGELAARLQFATPEELMRVAEALDLGRRPRLETIATLAGIAAPILAIMRAEPRSLLVAVDLDLRVLWACGMGSAQPHLYMQEAIAAGLQEHDVALLEQVVTRGEGADDLHNGRRRIACPLLDGDDELEGALLIVRYVERGPSL